MLDTDTIYNLYIIKNKKQCKKITVQMKDTTLFLKT